MPTSSSDIRRSARRTPADRLARNHYWRAKKMNGNLPNGFWPGVWWERLIAETHSTCQYCGTYTDHPSPDHAQALSQGGSNEWETIRLACPKCQRAKGVRSEATYRAYLAQKKKEPTPMSLSPTDLSDRIALIQQDIRLVRATMPDQNDPLDRARLRQCLLKVNHAVSLLDDLLAQMEVPADDDESEVA